MLAPGTITQVIGANGSGKSTLLRVVAGLTRPSAGRVLCRPASVGYAPERLPARLRVSARTYVAHMARLRGTEPGRALSLLDRLGLAPGPDVPVEALSKGNRQKVALAQALASPVGLLLLDEPAAGLDPGARAALAELLGQCRAGGAAVLVTTHLPLAGLRPDADLLLRDGLLAEGGPGGHGQPGTVRIELQAAASAAHRVLEVAGDESDAVLAAALAEGWSVVSVTRAPASA